MLLLLLTAPASPVRAQDASDESSSEEAAEAASDAEVKSTPEPEADPRERYNRGVSALESEAFDETLQELEASRRAAGRDAELRFRSAYNLGLGHVGRATSLLAESPEEALRAFYTAADWFRDAISQRPDHEDSRINLEVVLRRALALADRIAQGNEKGVDTELKALAASQRALVGELAALHDRVSGKPEAEVEARRREFNTRATDQRALLSEGDRLAGAIDREREAIAARPEGERTPETQMRAAQLEGVLHYLHPARERMGQARRQLRQRQSERAYRRASASLAELKRALDQLREPAAILDELIREVTEFGGATAALAMSAAELPGMAAAEPLPAWLTAESLHDDSENAALRTQELDQKLLAGLEQQAAADNPEQAALLEAMSAAEPGVANAASELELAATALGSGDPGAALPHLRNALLALSDARERFLDLRGLIELIYSDEQRIAEVLGGPAEAAVRREYQPALRELQDRNIERAERLAVKITEEAAAPPQPGPDGSPPDPEAAETQRQRFDLATQLLVLALGNMDGVKQALAKDDVALWSEANDSGGQAIENLEALRRLFFSIVEELRDTHRQQVDLADATQDAAALNESSASVDDARVGPLTPRQQALAERTAAIASALEEQSNQSGGLLEEETDAAETSRRLRQAGEHVLFAEDEMNAVLAALALEAPEFGPIQERQATAVAELEAALALLVPPEDREGEDESESDDSQEQEQEQDGDEDGEGEQEQEEASEQPQETADPAQLLQAVRDREAQRRRDREQKGASGYETVEKDW
jgi:hypothetical protein